MKKRLLFCLLISVLVSLSMLSGCAGGKTGAGKIDWTKEGEPKYGGTLTVRVSADNMDQPDPYNWGGQMMPHQETLFYRDWAVSRGVYSFQFEWASPEYFSGGPADSWEYKDPLTVAVHIREGVCWSKEPPMNGRELTAADVEYTYDRVLGTGHGFTEPDPSYAFAYPNIDRVVAVDDHTVEFHLKNDAFFSIYDVFGGGFFAICLVAPELVDGGYYKDWDTASVVGTAPFILTERVEGVSTTFARDPDYWGYDQRHPENQLPYVDELKYLVIPDTNTALAALRSGQIDVLEQMNTLSWQQAQTLAESNPDIQQSTWPSPGQSVHLRVDREPFTDIRVRKALQLALDLKTIAQTHYGGLVSGDPEGLINSKITGWVLPYDEWPAELQDEYKYDPDGAKELLAEAGYPNGFDTNIVAASSNEDLELVEIIKAYFMEIGVDMEINIMDFASKQAFTSAGKHDQMSYWNTSGTTRPPQWDIIQHMTGQGSAYANDPVYDDMVARAQSATTEEEAKQLCIEADQYCLKQHWQVSVFGTVSPVVWQGWVKGNSGEMLVGALAPYYYARWWIEKD